MKEYTDLHMNFSIRRIVFTIAVFSAISPAFASEPEKEDSTVAQSEYDKLMTDAHESACGLFTLHKFKDKLYLECPLSVLERDFLLGSTVSKISDNTNAIVGSKPQSPLLFTLSLSGNKLLMETLSNAYIIEGTNKETVQATFMNPVYAAFDIKAYSNDSTAVVVDMTDLFLGDNERFSPFDPQSINIINGYLNHLGVFKFLVNSNVPSNINSIISSIISSIKSLPLLLYH